MLENNNNYMSVNDYSEVPFIPYKIIQWLIVNNSETAEMFWKLLKYQTIDALEQPNLTTKEKKNLVWSGQTDEENYTIFLKPLIGNALDSAEQQMNIRLFRYSTTPIDIFDSTMVYELDIVCHEKVSNVRYNGMLTERTDLIENLLLNLLNGKDIGIGINLQFNRNLSRTCQSLMNISNSKSFYGRSIFIGLEMIAPNVGGDCG
jgi:hypothetical protein